MEFVFDNCIEFVNAVLIMRNCRERYIIFF